MSERASLIRRLSQWTVGALLMGVIGFSLWLVPRHQAARYRARFPEVETGRLEPRERVQLEKDLINSENAARLTLAQIVGGIVLLLGLYLTYENVRASHLNAKTAQDNLKLTEEGKLTDRYSKAIELLGNATLDVRLGAIFALERIARDSEKDHWTVMEVLTAFVREHATLQSHAAGKKTGSDVQAALTVIGRRTQRVEPATLDLQGSVLVDANLHNANLKGAYLHGVHLERSNLIKARLEGAHLMFAHLEESLLFDADFARADLTQACLQKASLDRAFLTGANLNGAHLEGASLCGTHLAGARLNGTHLEGADLALSIGLMWAQLASAHLDERTQLPFQVEAERRAGARREEIKS